MSPVTKILPTLAIIASLALTAGSSFAAASTWDNAPNGSAIDVTYFVAQLGSFDKNDVKALVDAKTVEVVTYSTAFAMASDNAGQAADQSQAMDALTAAQGEIQKFQEDLRANPAAVKLLADHSIDIVKVVDVVRERGGVVQLFVR